MLNVYNKLVEYMVDDIVVKRESTVEMIDSNEAISSNEEWRGSDEILKAIECLFIGYYRTKFRKQIYLGSFDFSFVKLKNGSVLRKVVRYEQMNISLNCLFDMRESDKVIEYMKQRGLTICPMKA